jgi:hypothetical protein
VLVLAQKNKVGITLSQDTLDKLELESERYGLSKSQYISLLINERVVERKEEKSVKA